MKLLLFDIDGTLIRSNGAGRATLVATLEDMFGTAGPIDNYPMNGKTDPRIITDLLTAVGIPQAQVEEKLPAVYHLMAHKAAVIFPTKKMNACAGVPELLSALQQQEGVMLGLLTGNAAITAPLKLLYAGLDAAVFSIGAYGSDHFDRNQLPAIAMRRATELTGYPFTGMDTVIIGDTPADILCARAGQATAVAVASGWHSAATLAQYNPDHLFENLTNTAEVLRILTAQKET